MADLTTSVPGADHTALQLEQQLEARARAGRAIRDLGHAIIGHQADDLVLDDLVAQLDALTARLIVGEPRGRRPETFQRGDDWGTDPDQLSLTGFDDRPVSGRSSPLGLDPVIRREGDEIVAEVTLHSAHEGAPGRSHGGVVASLFDDIYGFVLSLSRTPAFTGELGIRYEAGTPLHVPLTCRVRLTRRDGRKLYMSGELTDIVGQVFVRSTATFIAIDTSMIPGWGDGV